MRKSDKLKNFKKVNLIVENRYLESKGVVTESYHDEYEKYEPIMYIGEPKTFSNGKTVKYGDIGEYVGTEGGEECWVSFPASGFATVFSNIKKVGEQHSGLEEESVYEAVGTDLKYITFSVNGESYRPSKVINKEQVSNGITIEFGLERYDGMNGEWMSVGGMLTYYLDLDDRSDKLLFTDGRYENTIDAKKMIDSKYGLYEKIKQYVETRI